jgi:hypothetical protein
VNKSTDVEMQVENVAMVGFRERVSRLDSSQGRTSDRVLDSYSLRARLVRERVADGNVQLAHIDLGAMTEGPESIRVVLDKAQAILERDFSVGDGE